MTRALRLTIPILIAAIAAVAVFAMAKNKARPLTAVELQGEWVQDPDFLQHAGEDLDAQKREIDHWENYEFAFVGQNLKAWRVVHEAAAPDSTGWSQGKGVAFESEYALQPADKAVEIRFTDHAKAPQRATLAWEADRMVVTLGDRTFRLKRAPAENLRIRKLLAQP